MAQYSVLILLLVSSVGSLKYVYVDQPRYWKGAQDHCRGEFTDMAPVSSEYDISLVGKAANIISILNHYSKFWIGLRRNTTGQWVWSGGAGVTTEFWDNNEPQAGEVFGLIHNNKWHGTNVNYGRIHFLCYKVHAVTEMLTWDEALEFCRENHQDLASVASDTEMMLMQKELQKHSITTKHVWVGLSFLARAWVWVDGQPLDYEAWGGDEEAQCPAARCGALRVSGTPGDDTQSTAQDGKITEWNVMDCSERMHFLCY